MTNLDPMPTTLIPMAIPATPDAPMRRSAKSLLIVLFAVYLVLLVWIVLWKFELPWVGGVDRVIKLVPFFPSGAQGASRPSEVIVNLLLFVPFGVYLGMIASSWRWWRVAGVIAATSVALEVTQYVLAIGSSDITDVIVNTTGGLVGLAFLYVARRRLGPRTSTMIVRLCAIGTALAVILSIVVVASPLRFGPPVGGHPPREHMVETSMTR
jgi:glycopeptide antibiotics resistance protein